MGLSPKAIAHRLEYKRAFYRLNRDKILAQMRQYRKANRELILERKRRYRELHREELARKEAIRRESLDKSSIADYMRNYHRKNKPRHQIRCKRYYENNKLAFLHYAQKRRTIQLGATVGDKAQIVELVYEIRASNKTRCAYCDVPLHGKLIHIDHIVPLSRGGAHSVDNLCASCPECNLSKGDKLVSEWKGVVK